MSRRVLLGLAVLAWLALYAGVILNAAGLGKVDVFAYVVPGVALAGCYGAYRLGVADEFARHAVAAMDDLEGRDDR